MRNAFLPAATVSLALAACSSGGSTPFSPGAGGGDDAGSPSDSGSGADTSSVDPGAYPPGPYGATTGATLIDFQADGYRLTPSQTDSTKVAWSTGIDVAEYHRNPACKCLMVTIGATWCSACQVEQPTLVKEVAADPSFCVMGILQAATGSGGNEVPATQQDVAAWTQMFRQDFTVVQGNQATMDGLVKPNGTGNSLSLPFALIVKPDTMRVVGHITGGLLPNPHDYAMMLCSQ